MQFIVVCISNSDAMTAGFALFLIPADDPAQIMIGAAAHPDQQIQIIAITAALRPVRVVILPFHHRRPHRYGAPFLGTQGKLAVCACNLHRTGIWPCGIDSIGMRPEIGVGNLQTHLAGTAFGGITTM